MEQGQSNSLDGPIVSALSSPGSAPRTGIPWISSSDVTDGESNTLLVGEKWLSSNNQNVPPYDNWYNERWSGGGSCIDNEGWCEGWDNDTICTSADSSAGKGGRIVPPQNDRVGGVWGCGYVFGSAHTMGMNSVFCDGSLHFLSYSINPTVWSNLCCRNDGNPVTLP
jgi:hypothetical protein